MQGTACGSKTLHWIGMRVCPKHFPETIGHLQSCTDYIKLCLFEKKQLPMGKKMNRILSKMNAIQPRPAMFCSVFLCLEGVSHVSTELPSCQLASGRSQDERGMQVFQGAKWVLLMFFCILLFLPCHRYIRKGSTDALRKNGFFGCSVCLFWTLKQMLALSSYI